MFLMATVQLEGNLNDSLASLLMVMGRLEPLLSKKQLTCVDLSKCQYIGPYVITYMASVYKESRNKKPGIDFIFPDQPPSLKAFLSFSGFSYLLGKSATLPEIGHPQSRTVPLTATTNHWQAPDPIVGLIHRHLGTPTPDFEDLLGLCVREVFQNIEDHSSSPVGGWYCARCFDKQRQEIRVAVIDRGLGIFKTLTKNHPNIVDTIDALKKVIQGEYTAQSTERNMGLGISNLAQQVSRVRGQVILITSSAHAELKNERWSYQSHESFVLPGTGVFFSLPVKIS